MTDPGLCAECEHVHVVTSAKGSTFYRCRLAETDRSWPKYPRLPVLKCARFRVCSGVPSVPELICELCRQFYGLGWVSGTGGGISIRAPEGIYMAPSAVQKERIAPEDVYLLDAGDLEGCTVLRHPANKDLRVSECQPLFFNAYRTRGAGAVIHSHSVWAVLAARLFSPGGKAGRFLSRNLEMQKGLRGKGCFDEVAIPIIANTPREAELTESMAAAMEAHPDVDAVIVAGHGVYVWGEDWVQAKTQAECLDYLFRAAVETHRIFGGDAK